MTALAQGECIAYDIEKQMIADVAGGIIVRSWQVYRELPRLVDKKLIERVPETYPVRYRLTPQGRKMLMAERGQMLSYYRMLQDRL